MLDLSPEDRRLVAHALARSARDDDLDEERAHALLAELAAAEGRTPAELLRA